MTLVAPCSEGGHFNGVAMQGKHPLFFKPFQQPRHHHPGGVQVVGNVLVGRVKGEVALTLTLSGGVQARDKSMNASASMAWSISSNRLW